MNSHLIGKMAGMLGISVVWLGLSIQAAERTATTLRKVVDSKYAVTEKIDADRLTKDSASKELILAREEGLASVSLLEYYAPEFGGEQDDSYQVEQVDDSEEIQAVLLPLDYFNPHDEGTSVINAAILSFLSMAVYGDFADRDDFQSQLDALLLPIGALDVEAFMDSQGTEGAIVTLEGATIIVFRGTSGEGTEDPYADHLADINDAPYLVEVDGDEMYVHEGFWENADNIFPMIYQWAASAAAAEQELWVTGHSLGGALATHTALRLHYDEQLTVQGLHTFGSPRTGDLSMFAKFFTPNQSGHDLWSVTHRWVVDGDPLTTYFTE